MRIIDLYSGIGGWSLGLRLAGLEVVGAYDNNAMATRTYALNLPCPVTRANILDLDFSQLPTDIDVVVGSPPCTQFSYSNRGGNGDIPEGLSHIHAFLSIVRHYEPKFWLMENVPRVKRILEQEVFGARGKLRAFRSFLEEKDTHIEVLDFSDFGLPQTRRRCIAGRFPLNLLMEYIASCRRRTLGQVVSALTGDRIRDPHYGDRIAKSRISGLDHEWPLTKEEVRLNEQAKLRHPIYNRMRFPDDLDRPSRTITATCTRVSRESIIIESPISDREYRRLTVRERATLQSFPLIYDFATPSLSQAFRLTGNALPPLFAYYAGAALTGISVDKLEKPGPANKTLISRARIAQPMYAVLKRNRPPTPRPTRPFCGTIPSLHFGSGVRFELINIRSLADQNEKPQWLVRFVFGDPQNVVALPVTHALGKKIRSTQTFRRFLSDFSCHLKQAFHMVRNIASNDLQAAWAMFGADDSPGPFDIIDALDAATEACISNICVPQSVAYKRAYAILRKATPLKEGARVEIALSQRKLMERSVDILVGLYISTWCVNHLRFLSK